MNVGRKLDAIIKRGFHAVGLEVQRLRTANTDDAIFANLLQAVHPAAILDVGANTGQFAKKTRTLGYRGTIVSFEALPAVHAQLSRNAQGDPKWIIAPCAALGSGNGTAEMNVAGNSQSSSLLAMRARHSDIVPESAYVGTNKVDIMRLDDACAGLLPANGDLYLKIDTQGYEREVLLGAGGVMNRVAAIQLELSLVQLYEGSPTLAKMVAFVETLGFEMFNIAPVFKDPASGRLLQADGFFVRGNA